MNIYSTVPISFAQAALGGEVRINTVDGDVLYEVKSRNTDRHKNPPEGKKAYRLCETKQCVVTIMLHWWFRFRLPLNAEAKEALRKFDEVTGNTLKKSAEGTGTAEKPKKKKRIHG